MCTMKEITGLPDKSNYSHQLLSYRKQKILAIAGLGLLFNRQVIGVFRGLGEVLSGVYQLVKCENSCQINKSTRPILSVSLPQNRQCIRRLGFHVKSMNRWQVFLWEYRHPEKSIRPLSSFPSSCLCNSFLVDNGRTHRSSPAKTYQGIFVSFFFCQNNSNRRPLLVHCAKITSQADEHLHTYKGFTWEMERPRETTHKVVHTLRSMKSPGVSQAVS